MSPSNVLASTPHMCSCGRASGWDERSVFLWLFMVQRQGLGYLPPLAHPDPLQALLNSLRLCAGTSQPTGRRPPREMLQCLYKGHFVLGLVTSF